MNIASPGNKITTCSQLPAGALQALLQVYGMAVITLDAQDDIPGSFWGESEAGLIEHKLYIRPDTPVHSALHEACHYICMDHNRRQQLHTDAGGHYDEENGVCYLQILLAQGLPAMSAEKMMQDMDEWGYSFRLGSARTWFLQDAEDAKQWLLMNRLITTQNTPTGLLRR